MIIVKELPKLSTYQKKVGKSRKKEKENIYYVLN